MRRACVTLASRHGESELVGGVPAIDEAFPCFAAGADGGSDFDLVGLAGGAELGEESAMVFAGEGEGGFGLRAYAAIDFDGAEGHLEDFGSATEAAVEGGVTQEGFETIEIGPDGDGVGVGEDVIDGEGLGLIGEAFVDEVAELAGFDGVIFIVDASDLEGAAAIPFGQNVNDKFFCCSGSAGFMIDDELADAELVFGALGHGGDEVSKTKRPRR